MAWTDFPAAGYLEDASRTNAEMKAALEDFLAATRQILGGNTYSSVAPVGTTLTVDSGLVRIAGGATATIDNLGQTAQQGHVVLLMYGGYTVATIQTGSGNGRCEVTNDEPFVIDGYDKWIAFVYVTGEWYELFRCYGDDTSDWRDFLGVPAASDAELIGTVDIGTITDPGRVFVDTLGTYTADRSAVHVGPGFMHLGIGGTNIQTFSFATPGGVLDLQPDGGTVEINGTEVMHKGNDGAGSGFDADLLDGEEATAIKGAYFKNSYVVVKDRKTLNTAAGAAAATSWQQRDLNYEEIDAGSLASVASNKITLEAGTWRIVARAPAYGTGKSKIRLRYDSPASTLLEGESAYIASGHQGTLWLIGQFDLASQEDVWLDQYSENSVPTDGLGRANNLESYEYYTTVELWRIA